MRAADGPALNGRAVRLEPTGVADRDALVAIRSTDEVRRWWRGEDLAADFDDSLADDEVVLLTIWLDGRIVGLIQYAEESDPDYRHASIDVFVGPEHHRQGIATDAIETLVRDLFGALDHHRVVIDPAAENIAAIRCYERVGFQVVGVMREYERQPDGSWGSGVLMELLRSSS